MGRVEHGTSYRDVGATESKLGPVQWAGADLLQGGVQTGRRIVAVFGKEHAGALLMPRGG